MKLNIDNLDKKLIDILQELSKDGCFCPDSRGVVVYATLVKDKNSFTYTSSGVEIKYVNASGFLRCFLRILSGEREGSFIANFDKLSFMADVSRNAVLKIDTIKKLMRKLAALGYNRFMLYIEDVIKLPSQPLFGAYRGGLTDAEVREIDEYAALLGMEFIPCIQTLGHMKALRQWPYYADNMDTDDILLVGDEKIYSLLEGIIAFFRHNTRAKHINIGMDEAFLLGAGNYTAKNGHEDRYKIFDKHLCRVKELCAKYEFQPYMWCDMFIRRFFNGEYYVRDVKLPEGAKKCIPDGINMVYWNYISKEREYYDYMLDMCTELFGDVSFAGGADKWSGFAPLNERSLSIAKEALSACLGRVDEVTLTAWGDNGAEASVFSIMPVAAYYAEFCYSAAVDTTALESNFKSVFGIEFNDFLKLDFANRIGAGGGAKETNNSSKYLLYNDIFTGKFDCTVEDDTRSFFADNYKILKEAEGQSGEWRYIFKTLRLLADVLIDKCDIGVKIRAAYKDGNMVQLKALADNIKRLILKTNRFYRALESQWLQENKPNGLEIHQYRLGGLVKRLEYAAERLLLFADGQLNIIDELEEDAVDFAGGLFSMKEKNIIYNNFCLNISASHI